MRAALFDQIKNITLIEKDIPKTKNNEVLVQVIATGICGSEVHAFIGTHPFRKPPSVLGHETIGKVVDVGSNVTGFEIGDWVTVEPQIGCGKCDYCMDGLYNLCNEKIVLGTDKWDGAFAEYIVAPAQTLYRIPKAISFEAILTEPLAVGVHAVKVAGVNKGDKVAILGSGPIGLLTAVSAHYAGAETICLTDTVSRNLKIGENLGVTHVVNVREQSIQKYVFESIGEFDKVFLSVGLRSVVDDALNIVKKKGKVISIALFDEEISVNMNKIMLSEVQILGSSMYVKEDFEKAIEIIKSGIYPLKDLITNRFAFDEVGEAMNRAYTKSGFPIKIVVDIAK